MKEFVKFIERIAETNYCETVRRAVIQKTPVAMFDAHFREKVLRGGDIT